MARRGIQRHQRPILHELDEAAALQRLERLLAHSSHVRGTRAGLGFVRVKGRGDRRAMVDLHLEPKPLALKYSQWPGSPSVPFGARKACPKAVSASVWVRSEHDFAAEFRLALAIRQRWPAARTSRPRRCSPRSVAASPGPAGSTLDALASAMTAQQREPQPCDGVRRVVHVRVVADVAPCGEAVRFL